MALIIKTHLQHHPWWQDYSWPKAICAKQNSAFSGRKSERISAPASLGTGKVRIGKVLWLQHWLHMEEGEWGNAWKHNMITICLSQPLLEYSICPCDSTLSFQPNTSALRLHRFDLLYSWSLWHHQISNLIWTKVGTFVRQEIQGLLGCYL